MIEKIIYKKRLIAVIIRNKFKEKGIHFFTPNSFSQQLAYMQHDKGKIIPPHVHNKVVRSVKKTLEVLFIKKGKLRIDFYNNYRRYLESRVLEKGDIILLASGGHGFEVIEQVEMIEVKQGPYKGDKDKTRFKSIERKKIKINK